MQEVKEFEVRQIWSPASIEYVVSPAVGSADGLLTMWDASAFQVTGKYIHSRFIAISGKLIQSDFCCEFINVYGPSLDGEKEAFLKELLDYLSCSQLPCCLGGDFNLFLTPEEKMGLSLNLGLMSAFQIFVSMANLIDLPLCGGRYTWYNNRDPPTFIRLDRFLIMAEFCLQFPGIKQVLANRSISDHNGISLKEERCNWGPKPFRAFNSWLKDDSFLDLMSKTVEKAKGSRANIRIGGLLRVMKGAAKDWDVVARSKSANNSMAIEEEISYLETRIQGGMATADSMELLKTLRQSLWVAIRKEEGDWWQKSRLRWFAEGDRNTKFFHLVASGRKRVNHIDYLKEGEDIIQDPARIKDNVREHFQKLYNNCSALGVEDIKLDFKRISSSQAIHLQRRFCEQEIWDALQSSDGNRAPGSDGFNLGFFKKFWNLLKPYIMSFFEDFYLGKSWEGGYQSLLHNLNSKIEES
ncbi:hypothetical protein like AT1G43760 [Hibiscus trionum]|uniref:Reverse transcriptase n=1 Tax=Hibiscus trionum TaxID=183268 RepID=A0A9W7LLK9_HIBTR|nr:hypothetical protein like AT1G43760 [Hibiscus trionum]